MNALGNKGQDALLASLTLDDQIWHTMASICVKTRNLDILGHCLAHMGHARGARALREALAQGVDTETAIGLVAVQLSMNEEAVKIFEEAKRFDLLGAFWEASGKWDKALEIAESKDRINLRTTHYRFAQSLEADDKITQAIREYELAGRHCAEVPRMLWERGEVLVYIPSRAKSSVIEQQQHRVSSGLACRWMSWCSISQREMSLTSISGLPGTAKPTERLTERSKSTTRQVTHSHSSSCIALRVTTTRPLRLRSEVETKLPSFTWQGIERYRYVLTHI